MREHHYISMVYGILLAIVVILCICGVIYIPVDTYTAIDNAESVSQSMELQPTDIEVLNEDVREFHFKDVNWEENGTCLNFVSSHQEIRVEADGKLLFERNAVQTIWGRTPGFAWEYIEIPVHTTEVTVTVTACYPAIRDMSMTFYEGFGIKMIQQIFRQEGFTAIISFLDTCAGLILLIYGIASHKRSSIGGAMVYLGIFTVFLGIWSITDNGVVAILLERRAICSFLSFASLAMLGIPFVMFVRYYLQTDDKYVYKILLGLNIINFVLVFLLQILGIRDMKQNLWMTHIAMLSAVLYLPFSLVRVLHRRLITRRFWVTVWSLLSMFPPLLYSLYSYYAGSQTVGTYGNVFVFVFIAFFAVDVSLSVMKDVDAGKEAAIYQELAEKDLLTGCYNRNAYRNDTSDWADLQGVLLVTCDLNDLKKCNDTLGHACGDRYITDSAMILKKIFSQYGKVYRIGGDEFCIIIPDKHKCNMKQLLCKLLEEERSYNADSEVIHLQIACGYAEFDADTDSNMEDIRNRADERMYVNKRKLKG